MNSSPMIWRHIDHLVVILNQSTRLNLRQCRRRRRQVRLHDAAVRSALRRRRSRGVIISLTGQTADQSLQMLDTTLELLPVLILSVSDDASPRDRRVFAFDLARLAVVTGVAAVTS